MQPYTCVVYLRDNRPLEHGVSFKNANITFLNQSLPLCEPEEMPQRVRQKHGLTRKNTMLEIFYLKT